MPSSSIIFHTLPQTRILILKSFDNQNKSESLPGASISVHSATPNISCTKMSLSSFLKQNWPDECQKGKYFCC